MTAPEFDEFGFSILAFAFLHIPTKTRAMVAKSERRCMFESEAKHAEEVTKKGAGLKAILQI